MTPSFVPHTVDWTQTTPTLSALEAYFHAESMVRWKDEGGPVFWTAKAAAARAEEDFFRLLWEGATERNSNG